jgi:hypothetical protein
MKHFFKAVLPFFISASLLADPPVSTTPSQPRNSALDSASTIITSDQYGMVGDDSADNTAALQAALDAAAASPSRKLLLRVGTYKITGTVVVPRAVLLIGEQAPGDVNGYVPDSAATFAVQIHYTGSGIGLYFPYTNSNRMEGIEVIGSSSATSTLIKVGPGMFVTGSTHGDTSFTVTGPLQMTPAAGMLLDASQWAGSDIPSPVTLTATLTNGSPTFTVSSASGLASGMVVQGNGIPAGTTMTISGTTVTLSKNATAGGSQSVQFWPAVTAWNSGTSTITMSNAATGSHTSTTAGENGFLTLVDANYPGSNYPEFGGANFRMNYCSAHGGGVVVALWYVDHAALEHCYLANARSVCGIFQRNSDVKLSQCYFGGDNTPTYPTAWGLYVNETGDGMLIEDTHIDQVATSIYAGNSAIIGLINVGYEGAGTGTAPIIDLYGAWLWGFSTAVNAGRSGAVGIRAHASHVDLWGFSPASPGWDATGTISSSSTTVSAISSADTANIFPGEMVTGTGIPSLTYVVSVASTSIVISQTPGSSATETLSFAPCAILSDVDSNLNPHDTFAGRPIGLIDGSNNVTALLPPGASAGQITHGSFGSAVTLPANQVDGSTEAVFSAAPVSLGAASNAGTGLDLANSNALFWYHSGTLIWKWDSTSFYADATNNNFGQTYLGTYNGANRPTYTFNDGGAAGVGHTSSGISLVANNLDGLWLAPSGSTVDLRILSTVVANGTDGAQTIDQPSGRVNFAPSATSLVVTDSLVTANSKILCTVNSHDATLTSVQAVPGTGTFTIYANAAATAETAVTFLILN